MGVFETDYGAWAVEVKVKRVLDPIEIYSNGGLNETKGKRLTLTGNLLRMWRGHSHGPQDNTEWLCMYKVLQRLRL